MRIKVFFAGFAIMSLLSSSAFAAEAHILNIKVSEKQYNLMLSADLNGALTEKIEEAFMSGMPVTFTYKINLVRDRNNWWDTTERTVKVHKIVKYDSLKKEFNAIEVIAPKAPKEEDFEKELEAIKKSHQATLFPETTDAYINAPFESRRRYVVLKNLSTLEEWISTLKDVPLGDKEGLPTNRVYYVEVMAEMDTIKLTAPFNYIFAFVSFLDFVTEWESSSPFLVEKANMPIQSMVGQKENK